MFIDNFVAVGASKPSGDGSSLGAEGGGGGADDNVIVDMALNKLFRNMRATISKCY